MIKAVWHPADERMAAGNLTCFVEWLRATGHRADANPDSVLVWAASRDAAFDAAVSGFMDWDEAGPRIAADCGRHEAVIEHRAGTRRSWTYDGMPDHFLAALQAADAIALASFHLLECDTRPDDRLLWMGGADDSIALGGLFFGATVILTDALIATLPGLEGATKMTGPRPCSNPSAVPTPG